MRIGNSEQNSNKKSLKKNKNALDFIKKITYNQSATLHQKITYSVCK
jgi:hypothetical protein